MALPTIAIVGRPNVGKSTLFNRIAGERISIVEDVEGVTRDRIYATAEWLNRKFSIIDTGGIDDVDAPFMEQIKHQAEIAMDEADVIGFKNKYNLPVVKSACPVDGYTKRQYAKDLLADLNRQYPGIKQRMFTAILNGNIPGWPERIPYIR